MSNPSITLATSIVPDYRLKIQLVASRSWVSHGIDILSINCFDELNKLIDKYPHVNFVGNDRTGRHLTGKPVVFINDILHHLRATKSQTLGIINSDIIANNLNKLIPEIIELSEIGLVYGPRLDISSSEETNGALDPFGFDFFFFHRSLLDVWKESQFCLGMPFWDHWFPLVALLENKNIAKLHCNNFCHVSHSTHRDSSFFLFNDHFVQKLIPYVKHNSVGFGTDFDFAPYSDLKSKAINKQGNNYNQNLVKFYDKLTKYVLNFLDKNSQIIKL
mgnify:FL=1